MADSIVAGQPARQSWLSRLALFTILLLSAWIQFSVVLRTEVVTPLRADALDYFFGAYNLQHYGVYSREYTWPPAAHPTAPAADKVRAPGYPLFLATLGKLERNRPTLRRIELAQAGLGVVSVLLFYLIAVRFTGPPLACVGALLVAISPHLAVISTYILSEALFYFLLLVSLLLTIRAADHPQRRWAFIAGLAWGACALVRPAVVLLPPVALGLAAAWSERRRWLPPAALLFAGFVVSYSPWLIRNHFVEARAGQPNLAVTFLLHGSYPNFEYRGDPESYGIPYRFDPNSVAASRDLPSVLERITSEFRRSPATMLRWYLLGKPGFFLAWTNIDGVGDIFIYQVARSPYFDDWRFDQFRLISFFLHWPLMLLGLAGAALALFRPTWLGLVDARDRTAAQIVAFTASYGVAFHMLGAPFPRYGIPFRPLFFMLALLLVRGLWRRRGEGVQPPVGTRPR